MENFKFKKKYGQNFLKDKKIVEKIVDCANIKDDSLVIEVGVGAGILTDFLSKEATNVLSYEIDQELREPLEKKYNNSNVQIIFDDFLKRNINNDIKSKNNKHLYFISNLPYYITTPILIKLIESHIDFEKIVIMVQEEVGERFSATPGNKNYGSITVFLNYFFKIEREFKVNRQEFYPVPNVDSEIISFTKKEITNRATDEDKLFKLIRDSFRYKRKTIKNNLHDYNIEKIEAILEKNGLSLLSRAEQIPIDVYVEISNSL